MAHMCARQRRRFLVSLLFLSLSAMGCRGPIITCVAETEVRPAGETTRSVIFAGIPRQRREVDLAKYLHLPDPKPYNAYDQKPGRIAFSGVFPSPDRVPVDFVKLTPGLDLWAQNRIRVLRRDYVLMNSWYFEERIEDIVERVEAEETLGQTAGLLLEAGITGLEAQFGKDYDLGELNAYLRQTVPELCDRLYQAFWEIRRSRRGVSSTEGGEEAEWEARLVRELNRYGINLRRGNGREVREANKAILWEFLDNRLHELTRPRRDDVPPLGIKAFQESSMQAALLEKMKNAVTASFGSVENFFEQIQPSIPLVFGAFFEVQANFIPDTPTFQFVFRTRLPGHVVETNGARDLDGAVTWRFGSRDMILTGYRMHLQTLSIRDEAVKRIGLVGFPGSLAVAERFSAAMLGPGGMPHPGLIAVVRECVKEGGLQPLQKAAIPAVGAAAAGGAEGGGVSPDAASRLLGIIGAFYRGAGEGLAGRPEPSSPSGGSAPAAGKSDPVEQKQDALPEEDALLPEGPLVPGGREMLIPGEEPGAGLEWEDTHLPPDEELPAKPEPPGDDTGAKPPEFMD